MSRRGAGLLLLLGWPALWAGTNIVAWFFLLPLGPSSYGYAHSFVLANWAVAAIGSGVGGFLAPSADRDRLWAAPGGFLFGAALHWGLMLTAENIATP